MMGRGVQAATPGPGPEWDDPARQRRRGVVFGLAAVGGLFLFLFLLLTLRRLILPVVIGGGFAYICKPLIDYLRRRGLPRPAAIFVLFAGFCAVLYTLISLGAHLAPDRKGELELQIRARYRIHQRYERLMGLDRGRRGNLLYSLAGRELAPLMDSIDRALSLSGDEHAMVAGMFRRGEFPERYWRYHLANRERDRDRAAVAAGGRKAREPRYGGVILSLLDAVSLWLVTPLVFLILLFDRGRLRKGMLAMVPNRYFEPALTVVARIDQALGRYLRGTAIECFLVGASLFVCLVLVGLDLRWSAAIGIVAGLANAIPFLGPAIGLAVGLLYAIMAENVSPVLPFLSGDDLIPAVVAAVAVVQLLDNAVFQPYVLGSAVDLHPLVVTIGVMGGAMLFGFGGMLLAVPVMMVFRVVIATMFEQMRAYRII